MLQTLYRDFEWWLTPSLLVVLLIMGLPGLMGPVLMDWQALELVAFPAHSKLRCIPPLFGPPDVKVVYAVTPR